MGQRLSKFISGVIQGLTVTLHVVFALSVIYFLWLMNAVLEVISSA